MSAATMPGSLPLATKSPRSHTCFRTGSALTFSVCCGPDFLFQADRFCNLFCERIERIATGLNNIAPIIPEVPSVTINWLVDTACLRRTDPSRDESFLESTLESAFESCARKNETGLPE